MNHNNQNDVICKENKQSTPHVLFENISFLKTGKGSILLIAASWKSEKHLLKSKCSGLF